MMLLTLTIALIQCKRYQFQCCVLISWRVTASKKKLKEHTYYCFQIAIPWQCCVSIYCTIVFLYTTVFKLEPLDMWKLLLQPPLLLLKLHLVQVIDLSNLGNIDHQLVEHCPRIYSSSFLSVLFYPILIRDIALFRQDFTDMHYKF